MNDTRLTQIRRLATEAASIASELRDEMTPDSVQDRDLTVALLYLHEAIKRIDKMEAT